MKSIFIHLSLLAFIFSSSSGNTQERTEGWRTVPPNQFQLGNGINVIHRQRQHHQRAGVALIVDVGLSDFTCEHQAAPHLLEHLFFEGTHHFNANELRQRIRERSGKANGFTFAEETIYTIHIHESSLDFALEHLYQMMSDSLFDKPAYHRAIRAVESERGIASHFLQQQFDKKRSVQEQTISRAYRGTAIECYEKSIPGNISLKSLNQIRRQYYQPQNMTLVIISDHKPAQIVSLLSHNFAQYSQKKEKTTDAITGIRKQPINLKPSAKPKAPIIEYTDPTNVEADLYMVIPTIGYSHTMAHTLDIISRYLDEELFKVVRNELGLGYTPWAYYRSGTQYGYIMAHVRTTNARIDSAKSAFLAVYQKLLDSGIPQQRLQQLVNTEKLNIESDERSTLSWLQQERKQRLRAEWKTEAEWLDEITPEMVQTALKKHMAKHPTIGIHQPRPVKNTTFHLILIIAGAAITGALIIYLKKRLLAR